MKIHCHPANPRTPSAADRIQPLSGLPMSPESGMATSTVDIALARSRFGYQRVRYTRMPGKNPASATPSRNRRMTTDVIRAPTLSIRILLGTSAST